MAYDTSLPLVAVVSHNVKGHRSRGGFIGEQEEGTFGDQPSYPRICGDSLPGWEKCINLSPIGMETTLVTWPYWSDGPTLTRVVQGLNSPVYLVEPLDQMTGMNHHCLVVGFLMWLPSTLFVWRRKTSAW